MFNQGCWNRFRESGLVANLHRLWSNGGRRDHRNFRYRGNFVKRCEDGNAQVFVKFRVSCCAKEDLRVIVDMFAQFPHQGFNFEKRQGGAATNVDEHIPGSGLHLAAVQQGALERQ